MSDYHQIDQDQQGQQPAPPSRGGTGVASRVAALLGLGTAVSAFALLSVARSPTPSAAHGGDGSLLPARHGLKRSSAGHFCSCPPSEAIWACTESDYRALMNGSTCPYYRAAHGECGACLRDEASLQCRACKLGLSHTDFCDQCIKQGLNDVGCKGCTGPTAAALVGADVDEHGCRPSAGYRWCAAKASCVQPWERGLDSPEAFETACSQARPAAWSAARLGGDADLHGCRPSAGYKWCEATSSCIRPWEHGLVTPEAFQAKCQHAPPAAAGAVRVGGDADAHGCRPSAGYRWCEAMGSCIRQWEEGIRTKDDFVARCATKVAQVAGAQLLGGDRDAHGCIPSAGYSWCDSMQKCIRPWEHGIHNETRLRDVCSPQGLHAVGREGGSGPAAAPLAGADADEHGCRPSAGYSWCAAKASCVRPWELGLHTPESFEAACSQPLPSALGAARVGGDADAHGCRPSAGYEWCEATASCIRLWEHGLATPEAFKSKCQRTQPALVTMLPAGGDADAHGCRPSAGYRWCEAMGSCIRQWEEGIRTEEDFAARCAAKAASAVIVGSDRDAHGCIPSAGYTWCGAMSKCIRLWEHGIRDEAQFAARCSQRGGEPLYP